MSVIFNYTLGNCSCELWQIMTIHDFLEAKRLILSNVLGQIISRYDIIGVRLVIWSNIFNLLHLDLITLLVNFVYELGNNDQI